MTNYDYATTQINLSPYLRAKAVLYGNSIFADELDHVEYNSHITVKYGLGDDALEQVKKIVSGFPAFPIRLGGLSVFQTDEADVLKVGVTSEQLERLHYEIGQLPNGEADRPYSPHMTIAYLKKGTGHRYAGNDGPFLGMTLWVDKITFSQTNGNTISIPLGEAHTVEKQGDVQPYQLGNPEVDEFLLRYQRRFLELVNMAQAGRLTREQFAEQLQTITESSVAMAFLIAGGNPEIDGFSGYMGEITSNIPRGIANVTNDVFGQVYDSDGDGILLRAAIWGATLAGAYTLGQVLTRDRTQKYIWKYGRTIEHCSDCAGFEGQIKTAAEWYAGGLWPQSRALACRGYRCDCGLFAYNTKEALLHLDTNAGLMVFKDAKGDYRWVSLSSNAFEDRDRETVTTKALIGAAEKATANGDYGPLRVWHIKGLDIGDCDMSTVLSRTLVESGTFRKPRYAEACKQAADQLEISVGFLPSPGEPDGNRLYHDITLRERSILPKGRASNRLTSFSVR